MLLVTKGSKGHLG